MSLSEFQICLRCQDMETTRTRTNSPSAWRSHVLAQSAEGSRERRRRKRAAGRHHENKLGNGIAHGLSRISPLFSKLCTETHAARLPFSPHSLTTPYLLLGFLPRDALVHSAVMRLLSSVCLSVCLSVTFRYRDDIGWKSWKLIVRSIRPTPSLFVAQRPST